MKKILVPLLVVLVFVLSACAKTATSAPLPGLTDAAIESPAVVSAEPASIAAEPSADTAAVVPVASFPVLDEEAAFWSTLNCDQFVDADVVEITDPLGNNNKPLVNDEKWQALFLCGKVNYAFGSDTTHKMPYLSEADLSDTIKDGLTKGYIVLKLVEPNVTGFGWQKEFVYFETIDEMDKSGTGELEITMNTGDKAKGGINTGSFWIIPARDLESNLVDGTIADLATFCDGKAVMSFANDGERTYLPSANPCTATTQYLLIQPFFSGCDGATTTPSCGVEFVSSYAWADLMKVPNFNYLHGSLKVAK